MIKLYRQSVLLNHIFGISEHEVAVSLQMNDSIGYQKLTVTFHKIGRISRLVAFFICGSEKVSQISLTSPSAKKPVDDLDVGTQESHILHAGLKRFGSSRPHTGAFDIYAIKFLSGNIRPVRRYIRHVRNPIRVQSDYRS